MPRDGDLVYSLADVGVAHLGLAVRAVGVAVVDDLEMLEDLDVQIDVVRARFVRGRPDRPWAEAGTRPVRRRDVERGAHDGDVGLPLVEVLRVGQERSLPERRQPAEHVAELELLVHAGGEMASRLGHVAHRSSVISGGLSAECIARTSPRKREQPRVPQPA